MLRCNVALRENREKLDSSQWHSADMVKSKLFCKKCQYMYISQQLIELDDHVVKTVRFNVVERHGIKPRIWLNFLYL